jgi:hypothetical protein
MPPISTQNSAPQSHSLSSAGFAAATALAESARAQESQDARIELLVREILQYDPQLARILLQDSRNRLLNA